jgi:hypothetical protein
MSNFFDSEIVRSEMVEISQLQEEIYGSVFKFPYMDRESKIRHIDLLEKLLEKQKVLYTRLTLSDDLQAKEMKDNILKSASLMGLNPNIDMNILFGNMLELIKTMKIKILED